MAAVTISSVRIVRKTVYHQNVEVGEAFDAGEFVRFSSAGKLELGNNTSAAEVGKGGGLAVSDGELYNTATVIREGLLDVGDALGTLAFGTKIYLGGTDGALVDADPGENETQTLTIGGSPTGGTFTITFDGEETTDIAYDASAATIQAALEALSTIGAGNANVTGTGPFVIEFIGELANTNVSLAVGDGTSLTGGSDPDATIALTNAGVHSVEVGYVVPVWGAATVDRLLLVDVKD